jgi:hypothetical protein
LHRANPITGLAASAASESRIKSRPANTPQCNNYRPGISSFVSRNPQKIQKIATFSADAVKNGQESARQRRRVGFAHRWAKPTLRAWNATP